MSYTPPAGNAANFSWSGASAYTPPTGSAANFSWGTGNFASATGFQATKFGRPVAGLPATGFKSTAYGTPRYSLLSLATGFAATKFGQSAAKIVKVTQAAGFASTTFGPKPVAVGLAAGFSPTTFGTPKNTPNAVGAAPSTRVPIPSIPLKATGIAPATTFGTAAAFKRQLATGTLFTQFGLGKIKPYAIGFRSPGPGIPSIPLKASGTAPTVVFGTALGKEVKSPTGFRSTAFGRPGAKPIAVGTLFTKFGAASGKQVFRAASFGPTARVSPVYRTVRQIVPATGFSSTRFGLPSETVAARSAIGCTAATYGARNTVLGTPTARWKQFAAATGFAPTAFGAPRGLGGRAAAGFSSTVLGTPRLRLGLYSTGWRSPTYGVPTLRLPTAATALGPTTIFGAPGSSRSRSYRTYGINATGRLGQPRAYQYVPRRPTGWVAAVLGTPQAQDRHRTVMTAPTCSFGTPLLKRNTTC